MKWLTDRGDPRVIRALGRKCGICGAGKGEDCRNPYGGTLNRIVHMERAEKGIVAP